MWTMQYLKDYQTFVGTARYWTESFAKASSLGTEEKVLSLSRKIISAFIMSIVLNKRIFY